MDRTFHLLSPKYLVLQDKRFNKFYDTETEISRMDSQLDSKIVNNPKVWLKNRDKTLKNHNCKPNESFIELKIILGFSLHFVVRENY